MQMKIILVAGGSGGHIYPCLEMAKFFKNQGNEVLLCGCNDSMEERIYKENNLPFIGLDITRKKISSFLKNRKKVAKIYDEFKPDAILLFGNYISVSFAIVAIIKKIPIYLHEQNVIYGSANMLLGVFAKRIYLSLPIEKNPYRRKTLIVGNPKGDTKSNLVKFKNKYNVLIVMGSLGSSSINKVLKEFVNIVDNSVDFHIVVGKKYYDDFISKVMVNDNVHLYPYINNLSDYVKSCDVFVSRAGATTISEILSNGAASIIIPSPYVKNNHQHLNAKYLEKNNACILIEESSLDATKLKETINELINNYSKRLNLKINARKLAILDSKKKMYMDMVN